ncbi:hypothetical protein Pse7429DRAFT_4765 [Pseudanabaena biceps PCC 7429]|uniref:Uncharacterized protein n=1 Tax=Pseudanabaena biceps PCC 7429 TaxID=927668 RepID=L8MTJ6_9CYAN|nr:hypothetical protein Pse7429DRAFT_4765 [Pseudanabaena biceps PCC 7429]
MTSEAVEEQELVLCIGDTTYLDYGKIKAKTGRVWTNGKWVGTD